MLNKTSQLKILDILKNASSIFSLSDFEVDFSSSYSKVIITFKHEPEYNLDVIYEERYSYSTVVASNNRNLWGGSTETKTEKLTSKYDIKVCPGEDSLNETWHIMTLSDLQGIIGKWIKFLDLELTVDDLTEVNQEEKNIIKEKIKASISHHLEPYIDNRDTRFNSNEVDDITKKFNQIIKTLEQDNILLSEEIERLKKIISETTNSLSRFKKGTWFEITTNKFAEWATGIENAKRLIDAIKLLTI